MKKITLTIFIVLFIRITILSQSISNTIGTSGSFVIQDNTTTFFSLSQSNGNLSLSNNLFLPNTLSSSLGIIYKGSDRFIHDYKLPGSDGFNLFIGVNAGNFTLGGTHNSEGSYNTGVGQLTLSAITTGFNNSAFGTTSLFSNTTGNGNSAFGTSSLSSNTTGGVNSAFGLSSLQQNTVGHFNSAFGYASLNENISGYFNSSLGSYSLMFNTTGSNNSAFGTQALYLNSIGSNNSAFGFHAGNTVTTGSNLTLIGNNAQPSSGSAINEITFGDGNITTIRANVQSITSLSDERDKKNIKDLNLGIDFLMKLKPRLFNWDKREWYDNNESDGSKMLNEPTAGFIAQEFDELQTSENVEWLNLVLKTNPEKLEATYGNLLPVIVKAIQDLKEENENLKKENHELITKLKTENENEINKILEMNNLLTKRLHEFEENQRNISLELKQLKEEKNTLTIKTN